MSKRIVNIENGESSPTTMSDLLNAAEASWKAGDKQRAFITLLGAMAMMSAGVAQAMKASAELHRELSELKAKLKE